jgi:hypothetical protein
MVVLRLAGPILCSQTVTELDLRRSLTREKGFDLVCSSLYLANIHHILARSVIYAMPLCCNRMARRNEHRHKIYVQELSYQHI